MRTPDTARSAHSRRSQSVPGIFIQLTYSTTVSILHTGWLNDQPLESVPIALSLFPDTKPLYVNTFGRVQIRLYRNCATQYTSAVIKSTESLRLSSNYPPREIFRILSRYSKQTVAASIPAPPLIAPFPQREQCSTFGICPRVQQRLSHHLTRGRWQFVFLLYTHT